jgi:CDGSH-type Zn-finger protein
MPDNFLKIQVTKKGPYIVTGDVKVVFDNGTEDLKTGVVAFCRCGGSSKKPYCDGTHTIIGFTG